SSDQHQRQKWEANGDHLVSQVIQNRCGWQKSANGVLPFVKRKQYEAEDQRGGHSGDFEWVCRKACSEGSLIPGVSKAAVLNLKAECQHRQGLKTHADEKRSSSALLCSIALFLQSQEIESACCYGT